MIDVLKPGLMSTVQDLGRRGHRAIGVPLGGALDAFSLRAANALVGNPDDAPALEFTLTGPTLRFHNDAVIALCGGRFELQVDDLALPMWRPLRLGAGTTLKIGRALRGARGYLAFAGGLDVPSVLDGRGCLPGSGFPGLAGQALQEGDRLRIRGMSLAGRSWPRADIGVRMARWWANPAPILELDQPAEITLLPGRDSVTDVDLLHDSAWRVSARSNRMGLRLEGPGLELLEPAPTISEPVVPGTLQLPPEGGPILLLADAQTIGGYPRIGHVARADLPRLAQLAPGEPLRFVPGSQETAIDKLRQMERHLQKLRTAAQQVMGE
jgi:antagonist of KipI